MKNFLRYTFEVNGFEVEAKFEQSTIEQVFLPLVRDLGALPRDKNRRSIVFLAAPPACGKSTLAAFLQYLSERTPGAQPLQALGLDGFHYHQDYIACHSVTRDGREMPMRLVKGAPDTYDTEKLRALLTRCARGEAARWPYYDRRLHDPVEDEIPVARDILLIEGNWLLLDDPVWRDLPHDYSIWIAADPQDLRERLIARKIKGGLSRAQAEAWLEACDLPNVKTCLAHSGGASLRLRMTLDGDYERV